LEAERLRDIEPDLGAKWGCGDLFTARVLCLIDLVLNGLVG
jgi:hypothetical protein